MIERKADRRKGVSSHFTSPQHDRRRPQYERRGTVPEKPELPPVVQLYGERRRNPNER